MLRSLVALVAISCTPAAPPTAAATPTESRPPASDPAPTPAPAATTTPDDVWRFTTLVTNGPAGMLGKHAHYELTFDLRHSIPTAKLRRVGVEGKPLADDAIMVATTTPDRTPWADGTETPITMRFDLRSSKGRQPIVVHAWLAGDRMIGRWYHDHGTGIEGDGDGNSVTGVLVGRLGVPELVALESANELPCSICCDAIVNCGGMGSQSCNASNACLAACSPPDRASLEPLPKGKRMIDQKTGCNADSG